MTRSLEFDSGLTSAYPRLLSYARKLTSGDVATARDLVQETVMRAMEHSEQFRTGTNFIGWLMVICRNSWFNRGRRAGRLVFVGDDAFRLDRVAPDDPETVALAGEARISIAALPLDMQDVLAAAGDGLTMEEICVEFGIAGGTAKSRLSRARSRLLEAMGE